MRKFSFIFLLAVLPLALSADDTVSGLVITKTNGERVEVAIAHLRSIKFGSDTMVLYRQSADPISVPLAEVQSLTFDVTINGGLHYFQCYDDCINSPGIINFAGGTTVCYATNNDAVDSNYGRSGAITISGGNLFAYSGAGGAEEGIDCDNNSYITVTGGIAISAGGSQGGGGMGSSSSSIGSASQGYYLGSSPSSYSTTYYYTLCNTSGEAICTYRFEKNVSNSLSLLTAPNLGTGSITVKQGTSEPTSASIIVKSTTDAPVFWITPEVSTTSTAATIQAK